MYSEAKIARSEELPCSLGSSVFSDYDLSSFSLALTLFLIKRMVLFPFSDLAQTDLTLFSHLMLERIKNFFIRNEEVSGYHSK